MKNLLPLFVQLVGIVVTSVGVALWNPAAGVAVGGVGLLLEGIALERGS